jgi:hypothetical protein
VKDLVELVLKKLDEDRDGRVSENDYVSAVTKERLLLEAFGQCLPTPKVYKLCQALSSQYLLNSDVHFFMFQGH